MPKRDNGVTLIELVIAVAVVALLVGIGSASYFGARNRKVLEDQVSEIVADLRLAMSSSRAQEGGEGWGIHFENPSGEDGDFYEIWSGTNYESGTVSRRIALDGGVVFVDPSSGAVEDIVFSKSTGLPAASSTIVIQSLSSGEFGTITVSSQGVIGYELSSTSSSLSVSAPSVTTSPATNVSTSTATLNGYADPGNVPTTGWFRYGTINPGSCNDTFGTRIPISGGTTLGSGTGYVSYSEGVASLSDVTPYYYCAIAENSEGKSFGGIATFTTGATASPPTVVTNSATNVSTSTMTLNGSANPNGSSSSGWFRYSASSPGACNDVFGTATGVSSLGSGTESANYSSNISALDINSTYYYCAIAENSEGKSFGGIASSTTSNWYDTSWAYRKKITIDADMVSSTQTNFPVLLNRTDADWRYISSSGKVGQSDGGDILFTSSDGLTKLDHEIEKYTPSTGEVVAWIEIPSLSGASDTDIYIYYGNSASSDQWNVSGTWGNGFVSVWHLDESQSGGGNPDVYTDSADGNHGDDYIDGATGKTGKIGYGQEFDGSYTNGDKINAGEALNLEVSGSLTISAWVYAHSGPAAEGRTVLSKYAYNSGNDRGYNFGNVWSGSSFEMRICSSSGNCYIASDASFFSSSLNSWNYIVGTYEPSTAVRIYKNGSQVGVTTSGIPSQIAYYGSGDPLTIGIRSVDGQSEFDGFLDEVRIISALRSSGWVATEYNNQNSPSTFYSVGVEETSP